MQKNNEKKGGLFKGKKLLFAAWACEDKNYTCYQYWYGPLSKIFERIIFFDPKKNLEQHGLGMMNQKFLELVEKEQPDYIFFWIITHEFPLETIMKVREIAPKTQLINFFGDDDLQFEHYSQYYALFFDYCLVAPHLTPEVYQREGLTNIFFTLGTNLDNFHPLLGKKQYDVTLIGTPKADRIELIQYLRENGINIRIFGWGWHHYPELREVYGGPLDHQALVQVANKSKINLCFTKNYFGRPSWKGRVFEIAACRSFLLVEYSPRYKDFLDEGKEIIFFHDKKDLLKKIKYYLEHKQEREAIATNTYKKIVRKYDVAKELQDFFTLVHKKSHLSRGLPRINKKLKLLTKKNLDLPTEELQDTEYVYFSQGTALQTMLQAYSLEKSGKAISCCDYYVFSPSLGDYLYFSAPTAFEILRRADFASLLNIQQLMVRKDYFVKHRDLFKRMMAGDSVNLITNENTTFVSLPLLRLKKIRVLPYPVMKKAFTMKFLDTLSTLAYQKKIFSHYPYALLIEALQGKSFVLRYLYEERLRKKYYWKKLRDLFLKEPKRNI